MKKGLLRSRLPGGMCILAMLLGSAPCVGATEAALRDARIARLEEALAETTNPDSIRFELAVAYRESGLIEGRTEALALLDQIRAAYVEKPAYHREIAQIYLDAGRFWDARAAFGRALDLEPSNADAWLTVARLLFRDVLRYYEREHVAEVLGVVDSALSADPLHRDALMLKAVVLQFSRGLGVADAREASRAGLACTEKVLAQAPHDVGALLMQAVNRLDLNEVDRADLLFREAIERMPPDGGTYFRAPAYLAAPQVLADFNALPARQRTRFAEDYWQEGDPTPLTPANENQLQYWKRLTLADFYFGDPQKHQRGWLTHPGEVFVRYGFPHAAQYEPGCFKSLGRGGVSLTPPAWKWQYVFGDQVIDLTFHDVNLQGTFRASEQSAQVLTDLKMTAPAVFHAAMPGQMAQHYVSHAGFRRGAQRTHDQIAVGLGPFPGIGREDWWRGSRLNLRILDDLSQTVKRWRHRMTEEDLCVPVDGAEMLVVAVDHDLPPGRYTLVGSVDNPRDRFKGSFDLPLYVRSYEGRELQISDLQLGLPAPSEAPGPRMSNLGRQYAPNPAGFVGDDRQLGLYYEIYNLLPRGGGEVEFRARYTIVPRAYALAHAVRVRLGAASRGDSLQIGRLGGSLDEIKLTASNYSDAIFLTETARLLAGARLDKRVTLPIPQLDPGDYALLVTITDLVRGSSVVTETPFRVSTDREIRGLLRNERESPAPRR